MCEHRALPDSADAWAVTRCPVHSRPVAGVTVWAWGPAPLAARRCPCAVADRFVVAHASASAGWLASADVVVADAPDLRCAEKAARRLGRLPGCALVVVPVTGHGVVVGGRAGLFLARELCAVCLYPWLVGGGSVADLAR